MKDNDNDDDDDDGIGTDAHKQARDQIMEIAAKFFDGYVFIANVESSDTKEEAYGHVYNGGMTIAVGLAHRFLKRMEKHD